MIDYLKQIIKRIPTLYWCCRYLYVELVVRYIDSRDYVRNKFYRKLGEISSCVVKNKMMGGLLTESGEFYIKTYDGLFLFYNYSDGRYTLRDGQSLDFKAAYTVSPLEEFLMRYLKDGMVYIDIGANNGYYFSLKVAKKFPRCKVYSFEPDKKILYHLQKNIRYNGVDNITVVPQGLCNFVGTTKMTANLGASGFLVVGDSNLRDTVEIKCNTLDNFIIQNNVEQIDLIKVDIEGGEYNFLIGAQESIKKFRPVMILELNDKLLKRSNASAHDVVFFLENLDFRCYHIINSNDLLVVPKEKKYVLSTFSDPSLYQFLTANLM